MPPSPPAAAPTDPAPSRIASVEQLEDMLSDPPPYAVEAMGQLEGDVMVLGVSGKMGPTLARMAKRASEAAGKERKVIGVARFSQAGSKEDLESHGIEALQGDLLDRDFLASLPEVPNIVFMAGMKFGAGGQLPLTWAMNSVLPALVCERFAQARMAAFSTGNLYGLTPLAHGGPTEEEALRPTGEYAMSCLGRERAFEHFSQVNRTPVSIIRLNYAVEMRYGVLVDLARKVHEGKPIDLAMGAFNVIWQADANAMSLAALTLADSPAVPINVAGPETLSTRRVCERFGELMGKEVRFTGEESDSALLNNAQKAHRLFGYPRVGADQMIRWIADWVTRGGESLGKPTKFEVRDGKF